MSRQGQDGLIRLLKTSVQLTPETVAWLESNPLGIVGRGSTPSATIRAILEREMSGDGIRVRADKLAELTERIGKLEALAGEPQLRQSRVDAKVNIVLREFHKIGWEICFWAPDLWSEYGELWLNALRNAVEEAEKSR